MIGKKRKTRKKKPKNKWNELYFKPVESLNVILDGERKRSGFHMYNELACKICKSVFRNPFGLKIHVHEIHGEHLEENRQKSSDRKASKRFRKYAEDSTSEDCYSEDDKFNEKWEEENLPLRRQECNRQKAYVKQIKDESIPIIEEIQGGIFIGELLTDEDVMARTGWLLTQSHASARVSQAEESEGCSSSIVAHVIKNESDGSSNYRSSLRSTRGTLGSDCRVNIERLTNWKDFRPLQNQIVYSSTASTILSPTDSTVFFPTTETVLSSTSLTDPSLPTSAKIFIDPIAKKVPSPIANTVFMDDKSIPVVEEIQGGVFYGELLTDKGALARTGWLLNQSQSRKKTESQRFDCDNNAIISQCDDSGLEGCSSVIGSKKQMISDCQVDVERLRYWKDFKPSQNLLSSDCRVDVERLSNWKPLQNYTRDYRVDVERLDCRVDIKIEPPEENI